MPYEAAPTVERLSVDTVELTHAARKVRFGRLHNQMKVIHQAVRVASPALPLADPREHPKLGFPVLIVEVDVLAPIPSRGQVVQPTREFYSKRSPHTTNTTKIGAIAGPVTILGNCCNARIDPDLRRCRESLLREIDAQFDIEEL